MKLLFSIKCTTILFFHLYMPFIRAETIIRTNRLVGYQSTSRRQYDEID